MFCPVPRGCTVHEQMQKEIKGTIAKSGLPGKMATKTVCVCVCVCWQTKPGNGTVLANPLAVLRGESLGLSQSSSTGGGTGVETVFVDTSPMIDKASFVAWYIRRVSSRRCAS